MDRRSRTTRLAYSRACDISRRFDGILWLTAEVPTSAHFVKSSRRTAELGKHVQHGGIYNNKVSAVYQGAGAVPNIIKRTGAAGRGAPGLSILLGAFSLSKRWVIQNLIICPSKPCLCGRSVCRSLSGVRARDASTTEHDLLVYEVQPLVTSEN
jgi:hypothetical protein